MTPYVFAVVALVAAFACGMAVESRWSAAALREKEKTHAAALARVNAAWVERMKVWIRVQHDAAAVLDAAAMTTKRNHSDRLPLDA